MFKQHTGHLPKSTAIFCIGIAGFDLAESPLHLCDAIAVSDTVGLGR